MVADRNGAASRPKSAPKLPPEFDAVQQKYAQPITETRLKCGHCGIKIT
jgi:hypothetical protein